METGIWPEYGFDDHGCGVVLYVYCLFWLLVFSRMCVVSCPSWNEAATISVDYWVCSSETSSPR